jgi:drug/metabolite transporter (DMT)-like permease
VSIGPWLVGLGAALWGTESGWREWLSADMKEAVMVWWEHVIMVALALPLILPRLGELRRASWRALAWLVFSGVSGSAVGTVLFSMALSHGNGTVANVVLTIQPVISTTAAFLIFRDRLARGFFPWAALAIVAGIGLVPDFSHGFALDGSVPYALGCALFWGLSTVAGRGIMVEMSTQLASGLRVVIGLITMTILLVAWGYLTPPQLVTPAMAAEPWRVVGWFAGLATVSGGIPLLIYFHGLARTRASTAGYFEMLQTLAGAAVTWILFDQALAWYQVIAGAVLVFAVAMVQRAQASVGA